MSQLTDFIRRAQAGSVMSLESLRPTTLLFGTGGALSKELEPHPDGTLFEVYTRNFRVRVELLTAAGITIIEKKTTFVCAGISYRVNKSMADSVDLCLHLQCKQL